MVKGTLLTTRHTMSATHSGWPPGMLDVGCHDKIIKMSKISEKLIRELKKVKKADKIIDFSEANKACIFR